ncbi:CDK5 and ABL1 enzyme substrate 2-like [Leucoraja erinacea]|uniref:CDK5 and ABL1 enzyme substrate 2-like n=1 Tax=Leucoraja erinaceus TaxID=7782 RepID=UPI00245384BB|nr:CDK5 and ABL1 enzyme substrate 2-like [Leucoraja erinacea]
MAAATCGGTLRFCSLKHGGTKEHHRYHHHNQHQHVRRRTDSRRRQAALSFLNNISLDGRRPAELANGFEHDRPEQRQQQHEAAVAVAAAAASATPSISVIAHTSRLGPVAAAAAAAASGGVVASPGDPGLGPSAGEAVAQQLASGPGTPLPRSGLGTTPAVGPLGLERQRSRTSSGSPHQKNTKKIHFIKNMRQYDTRNSRIVLICAKRSLCSAFSILPYGEFNTNSDGKLEGPRQRNPSGGISCPTDMLHGLDGVELAADGKSVSYAQFLYPTNAFVLPKILTENSTSQAQARNNRSFTPGRHGPAAISMDLGSEPGDLIEYDPNLLDDPHWPCGKHKRVLIFASYMTTVIEYVKPSDLKKDMNETFKEKFPHIKLTLSKIRSEKREMRNLAEECNLEPCTVALSFVYFEKLVLQGRINKQNRKLCSGACLLLAAKISSDLKKHEVKHLIDKLEERLRLNSKELVCFEFTTLVALEFGLYLPEKKVLPHYRRLVQQS